MYYSVMETTCRATLSPREDRTLVLSTLSLFADETHRSSRFRARKSDLDNMTTNGQPSCAPWPSASIHQLQSVGLVSCPPMSAPTNDDDDTIRPNKRSRAVILIEQSLESVRLGHTQQPRAAWPPTFCQIKQQIITEMDVPWYTLRAGETKNPD